jgi:pyruvate dehydrogenase E2 component (dihydrolipoyllysine-residue acetyltransferase)
MPINILMPALSPTMEKGNLARWLKKEGDAVKAGDILAEIETDKATMEYEAIDEGVIAKILVPEGTVDVAVNAPIAVLAAAGEDVKSVAAGGGAAPPKPAASSAPATPAVATPAPAAAPPQPATAPRPAVNGHDAGSSAAGRIFASPLARRLAKTAGIAVASIPGTGPHGRVIARDVEAAKTGAVALKAPPAPAAQAPAAAPAQAMADDKIRALFEPGSYEVVPHDNMRRIIAQRLVLAKQTIPHFYLTVACTLDKLLSAREDVNGMAPKGADGKPAWKLSVNDFIIKALALALIKVPDANVTWTETGMLKHRRADVGVAVAIPGGLITPVVRKAETKSLGTISAEMKDFAARARARKLKPEEYQGGSSAISNLGMYGIEEFSAVINPPHATILAVGAGIEQAVVRHGQIAVATVMKVTLSTDHRAVDGALGAQLIDAFKTFIESPAAMLV